MSSEETKETKMQLSSYLNLISQRSKKILWGSKRDPPNYQRISTNTVHVGARIVAGQPKK
jgi:hypothetical protein